MTNIAVEQEQMSRQSKTKRIAFRTTAVFSDRLDRAVALTGRSRTDFILDAVEDKVDDVLRHQHSYLELSDRDMDALLDAIENPSPPNEAMLRAAARWRQRVRSFE